MSPHRPTPPPLAALLFMPLALVAADGPGQRFIGYRNDGTGVFPADCRPVTEWNAEERNPVNIVWRTPQLMYCNGGMIVAGGRLFLVCDRGGIGFAKEHVPDFLGSKLVCLNPADGSELWSADITHFDQLDGQGEQVAERLRQAVEWYPRVFPAFLAFRKVAGPLLGGGHGMPDRSGDLPDGYEERYAAAAEEFAAFWPEVPRTTDAFKAQWKKKDKTWTWNYVQLAFGKLMKRAFPEQLRIRGGLAKHGYGWCAWYGMESFVGANMPTPVSDGESVYVASGYNDVACYGLDGKRRWCRWFGPAPDHHGRVLGSPILVGDRLICDLGFKGSPSVLRALDKRTGVTIWEQTPEGGRSYHHITPVPLTLPLPDGGTLDVVWTGNGNVVRVADGTILASKVGCHGNGRHVASDDEHDILVICNGAADGGRGEPYDLPPVTLALELKATSDDNVDYEVLWQAEKKHRYNGPQRLVAHEGLVYGFPRDGFEVRRLETGEKVGGLGRVPLGPNHFSVIAGDHLYGMNGGRDGRCVVIRIGPQPQVVAENQLGVPSQQAQQATRYFNQGAQPFFSGNRIFIRSYTEVYCIGDPSRPTRLSAVHAGGPDAPPLRGPQVAAHGAGTAEDDPATADEPAGGADASADAEDDAAAAEEDDAGADGAGLRAGLRAALAAGRTPTFTMRNGGMEMRVTAMDESGTLTLNGQGMELELPFDRLGEADRRALAAALEPGP